MYAYPDNPTIKYPKTRLSFTGYAGRVAGFFFGGIMRICSIEDCVNKHHAKGFCNLHYRRWLKYGNPMLYKIIHEYHGHWGTSEYSTWECMKGRCLNKNNQAYKNYGGRGIIICERWKHSFMAFYEDMGPKPFPKAVIDQIDNDGDYEPGNCRWTTIKINTRNSRQAKLSLRMAKKIKQLYATGRYTQRELGDVFNVAPRTISSITTGTRWQ